MKLSKLKGMPIISSDKGARVGTLYDVLIDPVKLEATSLLLGHHTGMGLLQLSSIGNIGADAITIHNPDEIQWATTRRRYAGYELGDLTKLPVVDVSGAATGVLHDIEIHLPSGAITSLDVRRGSLFGPLTKTTEIPVCDVVSLEPTLVTVRFAAPAA